MAPELQERPLLSVFRFLCFTDFFVASDAHDDKFVRKTSEVLLCGQVLDYRKASKLSLVDDIDLVLEPGCSYICIVVIRGYARDPRRVVALPLDDVRRQAISRDEFVLDYYHDAPAASRPPPFSTAWQVSKPAQVTDPADVRQALDRAFPAPGATGGSTVNCGTRPISYVTERGAKMSVVPADCAWQAVAPREFDDLTPHTVFSATPTTGAAQAPGALPAAGERSLATPRSGLAPGATVDTGSMPATSGASSMTEILQTLFQEQRQTNAAFRVQMDTVSATLAALQHQLGAAYAPAQP
ncbi:hypothetical protein GQ600_9855 [Phytophthora cactorum]|nr:hypothetical protein GQ600_9855 [Phytophthora cactorum]